MAALVSSMLNAKKWMLTTMRHLLLPLCAALTLASPLAAQLQLPRLPPVKDVVGGVAGTLDRTIEDADAVTSRAAQRLLRARDRTLSRLLKRNSAVIERDADGFLARRGELLAFDLSEAAKARLAGAGFTLIGHERIEGLDVGYDRLGVPAGMDLDDAQELASEIAPSADISPDHLHFQSGTAEVAAAAIVPASLKAAGSIGVEVGVVDGGSGPAIRTVGKRGFATGAPRNSDHGTAVASLLQSAGVSRIRVADVYGTDPAGGNARAIASALGWLTASGSKVVTISLVGPKNALLQRAVAAARNKGIVVVAAVGNDGPAAPPAYPASYPGVIAVTGVDRRNRVLIEAGRALNIDYAAPGAGVYAMDASGKMKSWRGTSFATPLAAARVAAAIGRGGNWRARMDMEARDLGARGPDKTFGRGLVCGACGRKK